MASITNTALQDSQAWRNEPNSGAQIGETARIIIRVDSILADSSLLYTSLTIERESIGPVQAPTAWKMRHIITIVIELDNAHPIEPRMNIDIPQISGVRLPILSLIGPQTSWARANPNRNPEIVSSACPPRSLSIAGIAGR